MMLDTRLRDVFEAAGFLFVQQGYAKTQVSQIAEKARVATGTIYNLFSGKKALLHFVLLSTFDQSYLEREHTLPLREVEQEEIVKHLHLVAEALFAKIEVTPVPPFEDVFSTLFDYAASYQVAFNIINDNRHVLAEAERTYQHLVRHLHKVIEHNLIHCIERGEVRKIELPQLHVRNIIEVMIWWAMLLPYQAPDINVPVSKAKEISLDILKHAYLNKPQ